MRKISEMIRISPDEKDFRNDKKIFGCSFYFLTRSLFSFTRQLRSGWACLYQFLADPVEREETNWMKVKVSSSKLFCCSLLLSVLDTVLLTKVLANKTEKIFPASECSKDLLQSLRILNLFWV